MLFVVAIRILTIMEKNNLFKRNTCYINGEKKTGEVLAISEYLNRWQVCFRITGVENGVWVPELALFENNYVIEKPNKVAVTISSNTTMPSFKQKEEYLIVATEKSDEIAIQKSLETAIQRMEGKEADVIEAIAETSTITTDNLGIYDKKERYFQEFISNYLKEIGIDNSMEFPLNNGSLRADVVAKSIRTVFEVKRILDKKTLWQAVGQVSEYAEKLQMRYRIVIGLPPQDPKQYQLVKEEAHKLEKWNLKVIFLNPESETLGLDEHFQQTSSDLMAILKTLITMIRETIICFYEALSKATHEALQGLNPVPALAY